MTIVEGQIGILIPSLDPDEKLIELITKLCKEKRYIGNIVVVDDGTRNQEVFKKIEHDFYNQVKVLHHRTNLGKGAALKTGFDYIINKYSDVIGVATLDSDGQHTVKDLDGCIESFMHNPHDLLIGSRTFTKNIPLRSYLGNVFTNTIVGLLTGLRISDTQTGLRVIPIEYVKKLLSFKGERFEFEFDMLLRAKYNNIHIYEHPIETIYIEDNASSHFKIIKDSLSIYLRFLKFALSGVISFIIDIVLFYLILQITGNHSLQAFMTATVVARILSAVVNYLINHHIVFESKGEKTLLKYVEIMICQMTISGYLIYLVSNFLTLTGTNTLWITMIKVIIDFLLFIISYQIQKRLIFVK